jgi:SAM-dependent methyltransferase
VKIGQSADMQSLEEYHSSEQEQARTHDLLSLVPKGRRSVLDVGARDGYYSRLLTDYFGEVTALDLTEPAFDIPGVVTVAGDATDLHFPENAFDCVFCTEVLEHIPDVRKACAEILRVARLEVIVGVPFKQDTRVGRTTCRSCGRSNPPWGHVNSFDEARLAGLFSGARVVSRSFVGTSTEATNPLSAFLMDLAGNPWGAYDQEEPCIYCGAKLVPAADRHLWQKVCSAAAIRIDGIQAVFTRPHGNWIHMVFAKTR